MEIVTNNFEFLENGLGLSLVVFFPLVSALIVALMPKKQEVLIKLTALGSSIITFILSVIVAIQFDYSKAEQFQLGSKLSWIEAINSNPQILTHQRGEIAAFSLKPGHHTVGAIHNRQIAGGA